MSNLGGAIRLVEIKRPSYAFANTDMDRLNKYVDLMNVFLSRPGHEDFRSTFPDLRVTLVCDDNDLSGVHLRAFDALKAAGILEHITWATFLLRARKANEDFLGEAERQRENATSR